MKYQVRRADLPLAVYREVAAHLAQVEGVTATLIPQTAQPFDYGLSQVDRLILDITDQATPEQHQRIQQILAYYGDRYGTWDRVESATADGEQVV